MFFFVGITGFDDYFRVIDDLYSAENRLSHQLYVIRYIISVFT